MLHYQGEKFKQLFIIQFNTLFTKGNSLRFTKDQIDGVCKDLRYPAEFFLDIIFDNDKNIQSNNFEEDVIKWKNIISDFIVKGYKNNVITSNSADLSDMTLDKPVPLINEVPKENKEVKINKNKLVDNLSRENELKKEDKIINGNRDDRSKKENLQENVNLDVYLEHEDEESHHDSTNTLEQANEILQKFNQGANEKNANNEEEEEEDLDDYIKNLENKA